MMTYYEMDYMFINSLFVLWEAKHRGWRQTKEKQPMFTSVYIEEAEGRSDSENIAIKFVFSNEHFHIYFQVNVKVKYENSPYNLNSSIKRQRTNTHYLSFWCITWSLSLCWSCLFTIHHKLNSEHQSFSPHITNYCRKQC
uniref:Uncharacterized protein n=1 Tax=Opuntia streptacantha TaxID=393608 RepID=A0A7C9D1W6_OPUST